MKYFDINTKILQERNFNKQFNKSEDFFEYWRNEDKKLLKSFTKKALKSGIDKDWWYLVSKEDRLSLAKKFISESSENKNLDLYSFIIERKQTIDFCKSSLREIKLKRLLKS